MKTNVIIIKIYDNINMVNQLNIIDNIEKLKKMVLAKTENNVIYLTFETELDINIKNTDSLIFEDERFEYLLNNLPHNIQKLNIKIEIKYLDLLPQTITHLTVNYIKENGNVNDLPNSLKYFKGNKLFNKSIANLPSSVIYLEIPDLYNQTINKLPCNLKELIIPLHYSKLIKIPESLELLILKPNYGHCVNLELHKNISDKYTLDPIFSIVKKSNELSVVIPVLSDYRCNEYDRSNMLKQISSIPYNLKNITTIIDYNIESKLSRCDPLYINCIDDIPFDIVKNANICFDYVNHDYILSYNFITNEEYVSINNF